MPRESVSAGIVLVEVTRIGLTTTVRTDNLKRWDTLLSLDILVYYFLMSPLLAPLIIDYKILALLVFSKVVCLKYDLIAAYTNIKIPHLYLFFVMSFRHVN